jgi:hypothetical protein
MYSKPLYVTSFGALLYLVFVTLSFKLKLFEQSQTSSSDYLVKNDLATINLNKMNAAEDSILANDGLESLPPQSIVVDDW